MKAVIVSFRRGKHTFKPRQYIIKIKNIDNREKAKKFLNKKVIWKTQTGKILEGKITRVHGNKGSLRCLFEKGLPGQALGTEVEILDK